MRAKLFKLKIFFHSIYLTLILRKHVRVDWRIVELVIRKNGYCPCRFERSWKTKCPCVWHIDELRQKKRCRCGLFYVKK